MSVPSRNARTGLALFAVVLGMVALFAESLAVVRVLLPDLRPPV